MERIAELLAPFTASLSVPGDTFEQIRQYVELLLRWNSRTNLTAVRDPEQIITRHFGESLFAASILGASGPLGGKTLVDVGSGAGFPGIPIRLVSPGMELVLIESHSKKATFLREVVRRLQLTNVTVYLGRAEQWGKTADVVTLRAVERFETVLPTAASLVFPGGRLALLIGRVQVAAAEEILGPHWNWAEAATIPQSSSRAVLIGNKVASASGA